MRGFLGLAVLLLLALVATALVVVPAVVRPMVVDAVRATAPFGEQPIEVDVDINPVSLMLGSIDRIHVTGTDLQAEGVDIAGVDLTLTDVLTGARTFRSVSGTLTGVSLPFIQSAPLVIDTIELSGTSGDVTATARLDLRATLTVIGNAFADAGVAVDSLELAEGGVAFALFNQRVVTPIGVDAGALVIADVAGGQLVIVEPGPDDPWRIIGVSMTPSGMDVRVSLEPDEGLDPG